MRQQGKFDGPGYFVPGRQDSFQTNTKNAFDREACRHMCIRTSPTQDLGSITVNRIESKCAAITDK